MTTYLLFVDGRGEFARFDFAPGRWFSTSNPDDALTIKRHSREAAIKSFARNYTDGLRYIDRDGRGFSDRNLNSFRVHTMRESRAMLKPE